VKRERYVLTSEAQVSILRAIGVDPDLAPVHAVHIDTHATQRTLIVVELLPTRAVLRALGAALLDAGAEIGDDDE
jgi:hypothetical protein